MDKMLNVEVVLCRKCNGTGVYVWEEMTDYHKHEYSTFSQPCGDCNETGRMVHKTETITKVKIEPFKSFKDIDWRNF